MQIKDIAYIRTGLFAKTATTGDIAYLQASHFDGNGHLKRHVKAGLTSVDVITKHVLSPGEVLFSAKGSKNFATVFTYEFPTSVASSSFLVLTLFRRDILPEYLSWFLNSPDAQIQLKKEALGTSIQSISKSSLEDLTIPIPSTRIQEKILDLSSLVNRAKNIRRKISKLESKMIENQIFDFIKKHP